MELRGIRLDRSPDDSSRVRLTGRVAYAGGGSEEYWYDVPESHADSLSSNGNAWLALLLPLAASLGERLSIETPVDPILFENSSRLSAIWQSWYTHLSPATIDAEIDTTQATVGQERTASFFSGGVDSLFSLLRDRTSAVPGERRNITDLITVWGFDIPIDDRNAFVRLRDRHKELADAVGLELIDVGTNMRTTRWREASWGYLAHGPALASVALLFEKRFGAAYIPGSGGYRKLLPWGSHLVTDPLFSTRSTAIIHDAAAWLRIEKIEFLSQSTPALESLRVCWESLSDANCGECGKCVRTMVALDLFGALDRCRTLPNPPDLVQKASSLSCEHFAEFREVEDLRRLAQAKARKEVVSALNQSVRRGRFREGLKAFRSELAAPVRRAFSLLDE
ncbi:MAG: hypothetical protein ABI556_07470 [Gemmatimonadales bacterium]